MFAKTASIPLILSAILSLNPLLYSMLTSCYPSPWGDGPIPAEGTPLRGSLGYPLLASTDRGNNEINEDRGILKWKCNLDSVAVARTNCNVIFETVY